MVQPQMEGYVTLSGSYNTWLQAAHLSLMPSTETLTVQNLTVTAGNGCVVLQWDQLPYGNVSGYNVCRIVSGMRVLLNTSGPVRTSTYADTNGTQGLPNGQQVTYQVDVVDLNNNDIIDQTFVLKNMNDTLLDHLQLRCSTPNAFRVLTTLKSLASFAPQPVLPGMGLPTLKPGEEMTLYVTLNLAAIPPGKVYQWIDVVTPDTGQPIARLEMTGEVLPIVSFMPEFVDFRHVPAGQTKTINLTVRIDPRLAPSGSIPELFCSNPYVRIQPVPLDLKMLRKSPLLTLKQKAEGLYSYQLTLWEDASIGNITGSISVASITPPAEGRPKNLPAIDPTIAAAALRSASAFLTGRVEGDISAAPTSVVFGAVKQGQEATQSVLISPKTVISLQGTQLSTPTPWLSARWVAETDVLPINPHPERPLPQRLEVILSPNTPAGRLQTELVLTLANGQRLVLPVLANVVPNAAGK